ncbi:hypothetical protein UCRPA7_1600 [Phaeoacremonium minimum UCRPA7]|uniref:Uncharacterized protein n=1 Tax=Phaeoacremonium minimum (strain UCR-PA7) TaxID=1286976 RepID=R8BUD8_PHAM7|nr:hypothetical protein UCRPA7_1600 [Phaeoacremonium minimum UCRPA7]EOO02904.1 hypothetical protein UCRPA7_1600 [Phaeoacremonium minimum UCRPA7]
MASLPAQHPRLALHLTDRALTPIISSGNPTTSHSSSSQSQSQQQKQKQQQQQQQLAALSALSTTALTAYDAAKRLDMGSPLRVVVEHGPVAPTDDHGDGGGGPLVLQSFMCPMSLALGPTGRGRRGSDSDGSLDTAVTPTEGGGGGGSGGAHTPEAGASAVNGTSSRGAEGSSRQVLGSAVIDDEDDEDDEDDGANHPPMLIGVVVAPGADDASEARRAAGRLERLARVFQTEWVAEQRREDDGIE